MLDIILYGENVETIAVSLIHWIIEVSIFLILVLIGMFILKKMKSSSNRYLNPVEFLPVDEIHTLKQVAYLILMAFCFMNMFYTLISFEDYFFYVAIFDAALSLFIAITIDKKTWINRILLLLLVPYGLLTSVLFDSSYVGYLDVVHVFVFIYFVRYYFNKFMEYTNSNGLGVTIILLFSIIFISFIVTQFTEGVNPLDSIVMVSNSFTSNGYAVLGHSIPGKINSIFLVWGGYIISGAGTATLTAAILIRQFNKRFRELEKLLEEGDG